MPRGVPNVKGTTGGPTSIQRDGGEVVVGGNAGPWDDQPQGEAAEQACTGVPTELRQQAAALLDDPGWLNDDPQATEPAQPDRVIEALLKHLAALNSKARQVGAGRDDLFIAESFRELTEAIIEERGRVRQV